MGYSRDTQREQASAPATRSFQWERNQSGEWERKRTAARGGQRWHDEEEENPGVRSKETSARQDRRDRKPSPGQDSCEGGSAPVYEEYQESGRDSQQSPDTESLYDTLPPTRAAYDGYPSSPPGLNLHPAQLLPPLRAWDLPPAEWRGSQVDGEGLGAGGLTGSGDELERLLNLVSLRARSATRVHRASTGSEPTYK